MVRKAFLTEQQEPSISVRKEHTAEDRDKVKKGKGPRSLNFIPWATVIRDFHTEKWHDLQGISLALAWKVDYDEGQTIKNYYYDTAWR